MRVPPPPEDAAQRWAAFGIVVLVATGATCAATTFKEHYAPPPPPPAAAPDYIPPKAPPPVLVDQTPTTSPAPEPPPAKRGTPQTSLLARPAWGKQDIDVSTSQYAPQHSRLAELFKDAEPLEGDLDRAALVCRARTAVPGHELALEDLRFRATIGSGPAVGNEGENSDNIAFLSAPLVNLRKGEQVAFEIAKVDGDEDEKRVTIRNRTLRFAGGPLSFDEPRASVECRELSGDALEKATSADLAAADSRLRRLPVQHLAGHAPAWGWPADIEGAEGATSDAAALAGWDDYRVKKRVEKINTQISRLEAERGPIFANLRAHAGSSGHPANAFVMLVRLECKKSCTVVMTLLNSSEHPWQWDMEGGPSGYIATAKTGPIDLVAENPEDRSVAAEPGKQTTIRLVPKDSKVDLTKDPALVGVCSESRCVVRHVR